MVEPSQDLVHAPDCDLDQDCTCAPAAPAPREGTLAWLQTRPHQDVHGEQLPNTHRILEGSHLANPDDEPGRCRVIRPDGRRCKANATRRYKICLVHLGGGMQDFSRAATAAHQAKARMKVRRQLLGIGPSRVGNPRSHARLLALERAETMAEALVNAPLDDANLGTLERQQAVIRALDATFPLQQATVELELPAEPQDVGQMGWEAMQALAQRILAST